VRHAGATGLARAAVDIVPTGYTWAHTAAMHASVSSLARVARPCIVLILVVAALAAWATQPRVRAADPSAAPVATGSPVASETPRTMCESLADLRLYVGFLRDQSIDDDGLLPVLVGAVASISEARTLASLVSETYRPRVDDLVASLEALQTAVRGFRDQGTIGAGLVHLGEAITGVGTAMDALSAALREPCPVEAPGASGSPAALASPVA